jgi:DNA-binding IclR family transcriptional regulator
MHGDWSVTETNTRQSPLFVAALERGITVLNAFRQGGLSMSLTELASATGLSKSAVQRSAFTLEKLGYLAKESRTKRYHLTLKALEFGYSYLNNDDLIAKANPYLHSLNSACGETCSLSESQEVNMVNVARFPAQKSLYVYFPIGQPFPMYCSASGRAYLSRLPLNEVEAILDRTELIRRTETTITDKNDLIETIREAGRKGYAWANGEFYQGDINVGVPIVDKKGRPIGAVNVSVPSSRWTLKEACNELGPRLLTVTHAISGEVGQVPLPR